MRFLYGPKSALCMLTMVYRSVCLCMCVLISIPGAASEIYVATRQIVIDNIALWGIYMRERCTVFHLVNCTHP